MAAAINDKAFCHVVEEINVEKIENTLKRYLNVHIFGKEEDDDEKN